MFSMQVVKRDTDKKIIYCPFVQQLIQPSAQSALPGAKEESKESSIEHTEAKEMAISLNVGLGNTFHQQSDLPPEEKNDVDLAVQLHLRPVEIIYQAYAVENLTRFFKVKNLSAESKIAARAEFDKLSAQLGGMTQNLNASFKRNKLDITIDAPIFILPFSQASRQDIEQSECWVFTVGDAKFMSIDSAWGLFDDATAEGFEFRVERMKFEYASNYLMWKTIAQSGKDDQPKAV